MENSQVPKFKYSIREKKRKPHEYFLLENPKTNNLTFDDYVLLKRLVKEEPIVGILMHQLGARLIKPEDSV